MRTRTATGSRTAALLLLLLLPGAAARGESSHEWYPLSLGDERAYRIHWDHALQPAGEAAVRKFSMGWSQERVVAQGPFSVRAGRPIFRMDELTEEQPLDGSPTERQDSRYYVASGKGGVFFYQHDPGAAAEGVWPRFRDTPVLLLPGSPQVGQQWRAGTLLQGKIEVDLRGEIVGFEDVEIPSGRHPGCLHVRLTGRPRGWVEGQDGPGRIVGGVFEQELWLAREIGAVKAVIRTDLDVQSSSGEKVRVSTVSKSRLERAPPAS